MKMISSCLGAVIVTASYYAVICVMNAKYGLGMSKKKYGISSGIAAAVGAVTFFSTIFIAYVRLPEEGIWRYLLTMVLIGGMSVAAITDQKGKIVPNRFLLFLLMVWAVIVGVGVMVDTANGTELLFRALAGGIVGGLIFLLCYLLSGKQLGAGDVKLAFVMGLYLTGQRIIGAIFYGVVFCCIYSLVQMCRKKLGLKDGVPLVPFLYLGTLITFFII